MSQNRIQLINCDERLVNIVLKGEKSIAEELNVFVPARWSEYGNAIFKYTLNHLRKNPLHAKWYAYLPVEIESKTLLGTCGFKGEPDESGMVEIGYEVATSHRNLGYATEMAEQLIDIAFQDPRANVVHAHTLAEENASVAVLKKCHFTFVEEYTHPDDGLVWKWLRARNG